MRPPHFVHPASSEGHVTRIRGQGHVTRRIPLLTCWDDLGWGPGPVVPAADLADLSLAFYTPGKVGEKRYQPQKKCFEKGISFQIWLVGVYLLLNFGRGVFRHYLIFKKKNDSTLQSSTWIPLLFLLKQAVFVQGRKAWLEGVEVRCTPSFPPCHVVFFGMLNLPTVTKIIIFLVGDRY